ncbi:TetR/AcrR family transcriptional regulator [Actinomadura fulvescens]|uniref:TetR/AcrR family transcriptional regulator n=1 Tax=Actinomadura fulvescens TaxID=46160 RepID=A0ABN3Q3T7_9ACTN
MAERPAEGPRERLVDAAIRLLERDGPEGLNARELAGAIGASTMAVYTHFGGMAGVHEAVMRESFVRFGRRLRDVPRTDDPVTDLLALGLAYREYALARPQLYRFMFGITAPGAGPMIGHDLTTEGTPTELAEVNATFGQVVELVRRAMDAGRIRSGEPATIAGQVWSMIHGYVLLEIVGVFGDDGRGVTEILAPHAANLLVGLGDRREAVERSAMSLAAVPMASRAPRPATAVRGPRPGPRPNKK